VTFAPLLAIATACTFPARVPLPAPVPMTAGGTPVPGRGVGVALAISDGLQGQELLRKELLSFSVTGGIADVVSLTYGLYGGHDTDDEPDVAVLAGKARLGSFLGPKTSMAVHVARSQVERTALNRSLQTSQNESLVTWDVAIPTEYLLTDPAESARFSIYAGPRLLHEDYDDRLVPADSFKGWIPGILGGLHLAFGRLHLFGEGTVAFRPQTTYRGATFDGGPIFLPTGAFAAHFGSPFHWDKGDR
jgi:hypothetical protein